MRVLNRKQARTWFWEDSPASAKVKEYNMEGGVCVQIQNSVSKKTSKQESKESKNEHCKQSSLIFRLILPKKESTVNGLRLCFRSEYDR
jgi:hypothetical protein